MFNVYCRFDFNVFFRCLINDVNVMNFDLKFFSLLEYKVNWLVFYFEFIIGFGEWIMVVIVLVDEEGYEVRRIICDDVFKLLYGFC